ncbi:MAG: hypothetical protein ACREQ5_34850, partial [Candidatus Dormibacteria bacterium]
MNLPPRPLLGLAVGLLCAACGGGGGGAQPSGGADGHALLQQGKAAVDAATAIHFTLSSQDAPTSGNGPFITGGQGDAQRPDAMTGTLDVIAQGLPLHVGV